MEPVALARRGKPIQEKKKRADEKRATDINEDDNKVVDSGTDKVNKNKNRKGKGKKGKNKNKDKKKGNKGKNGNKNKDGDDKNVTDITESTTVTTTTGRTTLTTSVPATSTTVKTTTEDISKRLEINFPRFPTEVDIMLEIVGKNVQLVQKTCTNDIRGRDRACCNSASRCFDDVKGAVEELDNAPPDSFSLMSACRRVSAGLKRDKICVQRSLSRCGGPDRVILQRRFDNRVDRLYSQFYQHCRREAVNTTTATATPSPTDAPTRFSTNPNSRVSTTTIAPAWTDPFPTVTPHDHRGHSHDRTITNGNDATSGSGLIIAGAVTGGIVLALFLLVAVVLWCRNRRDYDGSNGSTDSAGIFFQKRPNMFSTERPRGNNNNKQPVARQESTIYAEIDEAMVNPGYKPPVPGNLPQGYLSPVSGDESYTPPPKRANVPVATTRGQLSYGAILAANEHSDKNLFYHSTAIADTNQKSRISGLSAKYLSTGSGNTSDDSAYITVDSQDALHDDTLDDYEEPISTTTSLRYKDIGETSPPAHNAPEVPKSPNEVSKNVSEVPKSTTDVRKTSKPSIPEKPLPKKNAVKVLPSNPFAPLGATKVPPSPEPAQPVAKPRRKRNTADNESPDLNSKDKPETLEKLGKPELLRKSDILATNRDSAMSDSSVKSSHHYYVLEPDQTQLEYENSVSSSKLV